MPTRLVFPPCLVIVLAPLFPIHAQTAYMLDWTADLPGNGNFDEGRCVIALAPGGGVIVGGSGIEVAGGENYVTAKYDTGGIRLWMASYDGSGNSEDHLADLMVDGFGNVFVTGSSQSTSNLDIATVSYDAAGVRRWTARYNGQSNLADEATGLAVDAAGNVFVAGSETYCCRRVGPDADFCTIKYDPSGAEQWVVRHEGALGGNDYCQDITSDAEGNVYLTGSQDNFPRGERASYATIKYSLSGDFGWLTSHSGPGRHNDGGTEVVLGPHGPVVTGFVYSAHSVDIGTIQYDWHGEEKWSATYDSREFDDYPNAVAVDSFGNVYVAGHTNLGASDDFVTVKYDSNGSQLWSSIYDGRGLVDRATCLALDPQGNVYVAGYSHSGSDEDYLTIKYDPAGVRKWVARYKGTRYLNDRPDGVVVDEWDNVYVTGRSNNGRDITTVKYTQNFLPSSPSRRENFGGVELRGTYPNPFNPSTVIRYGILSDAHVAVRIFNALGEEVRALVDAPESAGEKEVYWDGTNAHGQRVPSGVYIYRVSTGGDVKTGRVMLLK